MSKTTNKFAPEVGERAVRMVLDHEGDHPSRCAAITSIAAKIGCSGHTLLEWVKKPEVRRVFDANFKVYGVRKVWRQMQREGFDIARCTVARLMRELGLQGVPRASR